MFIYISNKQLKQSAAQLISFFLVDLLSRWHSRSFQSLVQALRDSRSFRAHIEIRLMNSRTSIDPTIFFVFDRKLTLHIHIGQFHIWEALYENNLLTLRSFWSFVGFKNFFRKKSEIGNFEIFSSKSLKSTTLENFRDETLKRALWVVRVLFITSWTQSLFNASTTLNIKFNFCFHKERLCGQVTRWRD